MLARVVRPDVDWKLPERVRAGDTFVVELVLTGAEGTKFENIELALVGELTDIGGRTVPIGGDKKVLEAAEMRLPERAEYRAELTVPSDAMGSAYGNEAVEWKVVLTGSIPWWPDLEDYRLIFVDGAPVAPRAPRVVVPTETRPDPKPTDVWVSVDDSDLVLELATEDSAYAPGETIRGRFAVVSLAGHDVYQVELVAVTWQERTDHDGYSYVAYESWAKLIDARGPFSAGTPISFEAKLPLEVPLNDDSFSIRIHLEFDTRSILQRIPVRVAAYHPRTKPTRLPLVGKARWRENWQKLATDHGLERYEETLRGTFDDLDVEIRPEDQGVRASVQYPSLGLDLDVGPRQGSRRGRIFIDAPWAEKRGARARDQTQAEAFLRGKLLDRLKEVEVEELDDRHLVLRGPQAISRNREGLDGFLSAIEHLCTELKSALSRVPPPTGAAPVLDAWRDFAEAQGGKLNVARLAITDLARDLGVGSIETRFDEEGAICGTTIGLRTTGSRISGEVPPELASSLGEGELKIEGNRLVLERDGMLRDPGDAARQLGVLEAIAARLAIGVGQGPYR
jgi:hypothetical protein